MRKILCLAAFAASVILAGQAQATPNDGCPSTECVSADQVKADLNQLYATMRESHFNLFARAPKRAYDAHLGKLAAEVDGPVPKSRAKLLMQRLLAFGRVGHARTDAPVQDAFAYARGGGKILPINVRILDGRMLLDEKADAAGHLLLGSEILSIGGVAVPRLYRRLRSIVSADTDRLLHAQIEQGMPIYLHLLFGRVDRARVEARSIDGRVVVVDVAAVDLATMKSFDAADPVAEPTLEPGKREFRIVGDGVAYLRPGPFANIEGEPTDEQGYNPKPFEEFLTAAFERFAAARATDLIIDLRGNPGGDNSFSDLMIARIADRPFRFASRFLVKAGAVNKANYAKRQFDAGSLMAIMAATEMRSANGSIYRVDLPLVEPRAANRFDGRVWVLIDRHSYSNAAVVAATIQDYRFGTLMGEATADLATTFGSTEHFTLPHSGARVSYPKSYFVRPNGDERVRGVHPDIALPAQPIDDAHDRVLEGALARIMAARPSAED